MAASRLLLVEGWRLLPHSYAIANAFQCLEFLKTPGLAVRHVDAPLISPAWRRVSGLFAPEADAAIAGIPAPAPGETPDAVLRMTFPYDLRASAARRTVVFGTSEFLCVPDSFLRDNQTLAAACAQSDAVIVTPSAWSREGFLASGAPPERVKLVPLGVDPAIFRPATPERRAALRQRSGLNGFVFFSLGSMSPNKGMDQLLKAFAVVAGRHPDVRLVLKGLSALYTSRDGLAQASATLTAAERALIEPRLSYVDATWPFAALAEVHQSADAYVSPYLGEGFNMPVLEAIASGLPVVVTAGGSTDDFTRDDFALRVNARRVQANLEDGVTGVALQPDFDHLAHQMMTVVESSVLRETARVRGPEFVAAGFTWRDVARQLLDVLFEDAR